MAKRFGRNQRRQLKAEIARLKQEVNGAAGLVTNEPDISPLIDISVISDHRETDRWRGNEREVAITGSARNYQEIVHYGRERMPIAYRGGRFIIDSITVPGRGERDYITADVPITLNLIAIA